MRVLAAMSAPRCAGLATSRALLYPIPHWLALSVACSELSSVTSWKESLECPLSNFKDLGGFFLLEELYDREVLGCG